MDVSANRQRPTDAAGVLTAIADDLETHIVTLARLKADPNFRAQLAAHLLPGLAHANDCLYYALADCRTVAAVLARVGGGRP
jgi:hypothetical protein